MIDDPHDTARRHDWIVVTGLAVIASITLCLTRGAWLDEGYTYWYTSHDTGFLQAMGDRWMRDAHPPFYYAYAWLFAPLAGGSIQTFRLVNLGALAMPALTWRLGRQRHAGGSFYRLYAMLAATSPFAILYSAELRSYFFIYVLAATLVAQMKLIDEARGGMPPSRRLLALTAITSLLLFNVHYLGGLVAGVLLAVEALDRLVHRQREAAAWLVGSGVVGVVTVGLTAAAFLARAVPGTPHDVGFKAATVAVAGVLGLALAANPPALVMAGVSIWSKRATLSNRFAAKMALALALTSAGFIAYNAVEHNLLPRYVIGAVPIALALIAAVATQGESRRGWLERAVVVAAVAASVAALAYGQVNRRWETNAPAIAGWHSQCPTTRVVALSATAFMPPDSPMLAIPGIRQAFELTYKSIARHHRFDVEVIDGPTPPRLLGSQCPTLVWVEHRYFAPMYDLRQLLAAARLRSPTGRIRVIEKREATGRLLLAVVAAPAPR